MQVKLSKHLSSIQNIHSAKNTESDNLIRNRCRFHIVRPVHSGEEPLFLIYEHSHIQLPGEKKQDTIVSPIVLQDSYRQLYIFWSQV